MRRSKKFVRAHLGVGNVLVRVSSLHAQRVLVNIREEAARNLIRILRVPMLEQPLVHPNLSSIIRNVNEIQIPSVMCTVNLNP
jgi:hypothetical protein